MLSAELWCRDGYQIDNEAPQKALNVNLDFCSATFAVYVSLYTEHFEYVCDADFYFYILSKVIVFIMKDPADVTCTYLTALTSATRLSETHHADTHSTITSI